MIDHVRVLHVDDDPDFLEVASTFLEREADGLSVETATSVNEALDRLNQSKFDCVVSDYDMPRLNGLEFLEHVRELELELPFILFTGKGSEEVASEAIREGVTDYVQKQPGSDQYSLLSNRVKNAVDQYRARHSADLNENLLRELAENCQDILWMVSSGWEEILFINSAYERVWGRSIEDLRKDATDFLEGVHPEDRPRVKQAMKELTNGEPADLEFRVNEAEDYGRWVWSQGTPITGDCGSVVRIAGYIRDITAHKRSECPLSARETGLGFTPETVKGVSDD